MAVPVKLLAVVGVIVVALVVVFAFILPAVSGSFLTTTITVLDENGQPHEIFASNALGGGSIVQANGITISQVLISTSFTATSSSYTTYTVTPGAVPVTYLTPSQSSSYGKITSAGTSWAVLLTVNMGGGLIAVCNFLTFAQAVASGTTFNVGNTYYLGNGGAVISSSSQPSAAVSATTLIAWSSMNGCTGSGAFTLVYGVQVAIQAVGQGQTPSASYAALYYVPLSVAVGTISLSGTTTGTTQ